LAPRRGELLWDVGSGSGSVAIEWLLADASLSAIAVEQRSDRGRARRAQRRCVRCAALDAARRFGSCRPRGIGLAGCVFIGGGATTPGVMDAVRAALRPAGRLVVNAVAWKRKSVLLKCQSQWGGTLTRIAISRAGPIGGENARMMGWRAAMPGHAMDWVKR